MGVEFEENDLVSNKIEKQQRNIFSVSKFLIDKKIVKNQKAVDLAIFILSGLLIIISVFFSFNLFREEEATGKLYSEMTIQEKLSLPDDIRRTLERMNE